MADIPLGDTRIIPMGDIPAYYAQSRRDEICLTYPEGSLTWQALHQNSSRRARAFESFGVGQDDLITVALPNGLIFHETMFALWKLGATPHVISPVLTKQEIIEIVTLANPKITIGIEEDLIQDRTTLSANYTPEGFSDDHMASKTSKYWRAMSSGGSTGRPKIIVEHNPASWGFEYPFFDMPKNDCVLNPGPLYHSSPFAWSHVALFQGNHLVGMKRFEADEVMALIEKYKISWVAMVPTMMHRIWQINTEERLSYDISSLNTVLHLAAPMPIWLKENWIEWLGPERVLELYGGTEALGITVITGTEWLKHKGSVGKPLMGVIKILSDDGIECKSGGTGNVCFEVPPGQDSAYHYVGANPIIISEGWETLGDMGWMDQEGYLYLADRKTDMIIAGGANIYPAEVESALMEHPGVDSVVVIGLPHDDLGQSVHAIICPIEEWRGRLTEDILRDFIVDRLVRYKTPRSYEFASHSLRDDAGKTRRSQLISERIKSSFSNDKIS